MDGQLLRRYAIMAHRCGVITERRNDEQYE